MNALQDRMIELAKRLKLISREAQGLGEAIEADAEMLDPTAGNTQSPVLDSVNTMTEDIEMRLGEIASLMGLGR